jgi:hypothetical protein
VNRATLVLPLLWDASGVSSCTAGHLSSHYQLPDN